MKHADTHLLRATSWLTACALVVLGARTLAYALAPTPSLSAVRLEQAAGGPRLVIVAAVSVLLALAAAAAAVVIAAMAVRERRLLIAQPLLNEPRLRLARIPARTLILSLASSGAFALLESYLHWRAGLGWHGLHCLLGPVHRTALPLIAALSLLAATLMTIAEFLLAWIRRLVQELRAAPVGVRGHSRPAAAPDAQARRTLLTGQGGARAPPTRSVPRSPAAAAPPAVYPIEGGKTEMKLRVSAPGRLGLLALVALVALVVAAGASAHAVIGPPVALAKELQPFTLSVPTEKEGLTTTEVELEPPPGFTIDSFEPPPPGWKLSVESHGSGENQVFTKATWTGGHVPTGQDAVFHFNGETSGAKTYVFKVRQTYSDGSLVDWAGPVGSDDPAVRIKAVSSLGGGGSSTLAIVALAVGALALIVGVVGLTTRGGTRPLA